MAKVKKSSDLTLRDILSRLSFTKACRLIGEEGAKLIRQGGAFDIDIENQVKLNDKKFELSLPGSAVTIERDPASHNRLHWKCSACDIACEHVGAAFSLILEEKMSLGLAAPPPERIPVESLSEAALVQSALREREERARTERMTLKSSNPNKLWTEYTITSALSGKSYRLTLRGWDRGESYCSCPDFRKNTLGTCKHILNALTKVKRRFPASTHKRGYRPGSISIHLQYGNEVQLQALLPPKFPSKIERLVKPLRSHTLSDVHLLVKKIQQLERAGQEVYIYPDAEEYMQQRLHRLRIENLVEEIRHDPKAHPLRTGLLKTELLPYQMDGIAFAAGAGRAILADDMGLGKTIQGIGVAELLARETGIRKVLVICPTSLKAQWRSEIERFSSRDVKLVLGTARERAQQYGNGAFFTICNYEQVLRDYLHIENAPWDLIVLDEGQRIKNWETQTARIIKALRSPFALALSGTPLENRLDDLYSVVEFVDDRRLGPAFRFFNQHRIVDQSGKVLGYKNLSALRKNLAPILLRRTRAGIMRELPERTNEIVRITPTEEQLGLHTAHMQTVVSIIRKPYLTEMDLLRLQKALLMCRMASNSTYLVDKQAPGYSSKLERLEQLLEDLAPETDRKAVLFSEWTTMLDLIEPLLEKLKLNYVRLDGSVPQKKRQQLVQTFQQDPACRFFITTNAGSTGLNLQAANTVINVDLPWNPAVLEQRIARAHRMGQKRKVQVFVLVTEDTLEERLLHTLSSKHQLALAALDVDSNIDEMAMESGISELKNRLEVLLGAQPEAPKDESGLRLKEEEAARKARQDKIGVAGGQLISAAFNLLGEMIPESKETEATREMGALLKSRLSDCMEKDENGQLKLTVTLPSEAALDDLAKSLSRLLAR